MRPSNLLENRTVQTRTNPIPAIDIASNRCSTRALSHPRLWSMLLISLWLISTSQSPAQETPLGPAITYQGQLNQNGVPATGPFSMYFGLHASESDARILASQTINNVPVSNGLFTVVLNAAGEFGPAPFNGNERWLEIWVNGQQLLPRQQLTAVPYAHFSTRPWATSGASISNTNSGNVGIGAAGPAYRLSVTDTQPGLISIPLSVANSSSTAGTSTAINFSASATPAPKAMLALERINTFGRGRFHFLLDATGDDLPAELSDSKMSIDYFGNVGIGTSAPARPLHIRGPEGVLRIDRLAPNAASILLHQYNNSAGVDEPWKTFSIGVAGTGAAAGTFAIADLGTAIAGAGTNRLVIDNSGNVGIGTSSPAAKLDLRGGAPDIRLNLVPSGTDNDAEIRLYENGGVQFASILRHDGGSNQFRILGLNTNGEVGPHFVVGRDSGNVGIGTTTPSYKLDVAGAIRAVGLRTEATSSDPNIIGGSGLNSVLAGVVGATIAGGGPGGSEFGNKVNDDWGTVGGGRSNTAEGFSATVAGGLGNQALSSYATVGGGIGCEAGGGSGPLGGSSATVSGGNQNTAEGDYSTIAGGTENLVVGDYATVSGGRNNQAGGDYGTVGGGWDNGAAGMLSTVPGGYGCWANGIFSFAAGREARAEHDGAFVWGDSTDAIVSSTVSNQFVARSSGGVRFFTNAAMTTGVQVAAGGGSWSSVSDRDLKENIRTVDGCEVLNRLSGIPISTWNYKSQDTSIRHIGPMAQDIHAAFGVGEDDRHITTVDADGVALAAIQGLHQLLREREAQLADQQKQIEKLMARLARVEQTVQLTDTATKGGGR